jgi:energy-coupling factor transport system ATP-binding protein
LDTIQSGPQQLSRRVGFVWQNPEAQAVLDRVEPEIAFGLENAALPPVEMRERVAQVMAWVELTPLRDRLISTLSGGERQRVAIAAALALRPHILVLDEPTSQLDPASACEVLDALTRLHEQLGLTVVLAEHRLERVLGQVDRMVVLERVRVTHDGPPRDVLPHLSQVPPVVELGRRLGWEPLPLTTIEAKAHLTALTPALSLEGRGGWEGARPQPLLTVSQLNYQYNDKPAVQDVSLQVGTGELVAIMGANGSGKTTLLKSVVGLLRPQAGEITLAGVSLKGKPVAEICRQMAYLPQNPDDLLFAESVTGELELTLQNHRQVNAAATIEPLLRQLGLEAVAGQYPRDLSVGQRQRVALGAVTVTRPRLLLLDEPTRGLDYQTKQNLIDLWRDWLAEGMGILLVTHDVELVAQMAHHVILLQNGHILAEGHPRNVLPHYPTFAPQIAHLFPHHGWLTPADVVGVK